MDNYSLFAPQGWICPKCGRVYSPYTSMCPSCGGNTKTTITCDSTNDDDWWEDYIRQSTTIGGGSDYWDPSTNTWKQIITNVMNSKGEKNNT